ncbi:cytochrome P450 [Xylaria arbuscula]|nr:cytochrome P450 [Xylaria arbuscula]
MTCPYKPGSPAGAPRNIGEDAIVPIPQPPTHWFTGNLAEMDASFPASSFWRLAAIYGDIFKLDLVVRQAVVVSSYELVNEVMDETRFRKKPTGPLKELRGLLGDGLFTAFWEEENWGKAHRILMPVFGPIQIRKMFPDMLDLVSQLVLKLDRMGPDNEIVALAFDMIGICGFGYRFNSFYRDEIHPFAKEMAASLIEAGKRANRPSVENYLRYKSADELNKNIHSMWELCDHLVAERKRNPKPEARDLLNTMLNARDPQTGGKLSDENIRFNMVTFLVAGHETTSGTLSFLFYLLLKNPETYHKAQQEVDRVLGDGVLKPEHLTQFKYIEACIRETLRFQGPITVLNISPIEDTVIGGKYRVTANDAIICNTQGLHHDRRVWGDDADVFRPERLMDGGWEKLPRNAWKPFGNGARACIGRFFAEQEMIMAIALLLQRFQISMVDPSYTLRIKSTLTIKPDGFKIKAVRRPGKSMMVGISGDFQTEVEKSQGEHEATDKAPDGCQTGQSLLILYGSNAGTCKYLAEDLDMAAKNRGFKPIVKTMDEGTEQLSKDTPVVIITPSYEGQPADNARKFVAWLEVGKPENLKGVQYAVFGSGNSEWMNTFHRIPKLVDETMAQLGAKRIIAAQFVDAKEDATGPWEDWRDKLLGSFGGESQPTAVDTPKLEVTVQKPETADMLAGEEIATGLVKENKQIAGLEVGTEKRHMEIELPEGVTYEPGDYLVVLPTNPPDLIQRAALHFKLNLDDVVTIKGTSKGFLTSGRQSTVIEILGARVELATPASKRQIEAIAKTTTRESDNRALQALISSPEAFAQSVIEKRLSVLDLLEDHPSAGLSFGAYLDMLRPLTPRQYSISSSPLAALSSKSEIASLTYDVHVAPARSGNGRVFHGVASTYLATRPLGSRIRCFVRRSISGFHLPADPQTPIIMVAAGTGLAPMRGFIQQRGCLAAAHNNTDNTNTKGNILGPALLYFGCRDYESDFIYAAELRAWENLGAVEVRPAFSRRGPTAPETETETGENGAGHYKYTHERMWEEREEVRALFRRGAKIFVCGSASKLARSTNEVVKRIWREAFPDKSDEDAQAWLDGIREVRYVSDVFD